MIWVVGLLLLVFFLMLFAGADRLNKEWDQANERSLEEMRRTLESHDESGWG